MFYRLFHFGCISIYSYGLMVAIGFIAGIFFAYRRAKQTGENPKNILDLCVYLMVSALFGARIFYIVSHWYYFKHHLHDVFLFNKGGLVFYGASIAGIITAILFLKIKRLPLWKYFDICAPSLALGHAFGRIGCFLNGCCFGKIIAIPSLKFISIRFPMVLEPSPSDGSLEFVGSPAYLNHLHEGLIAHSAAFSLPVYPTQLISALLNAVIFIILLCRFKNRTFDGQIWWSYAFLYGISRLFIEFFRGDTPRFAPLNLTVSQYVSIGFIVCAMILYPYLKNRHYRSTL